MVESLGVAYNIKKNCDAMKVLLDIFIYSGRRKFVRPLNNKNASQQLTGPLNVAALCPPKSTVTENAIEQGLCLNP